MTQQYKLTVEEICSKLRPIFGKKVDDIYLKYAMAGGRDEKEEIAQILYALYNKNLDKLLGNQVLLEPPPEEVMNGEYPLAKVSYAGKELYDFVLREQDWPRHVCISGMGGSGKTTLAFHIIQNFIRKNKPFLVFDWKKSFRPLMLEDSEVLCFTPGNDISNLFRFNINKPPKGVPPKEWINVLCDLITESFAASYGVHKVLLETLDEAFKEHGVYKDSNNYPTWNYIKWRLECRLEKASGREAGWLESSLRVAHVLTFGDFGRVLNYKGKDSLPIGNILDKKIIFELNSLGNIEKKFFCEFILTYIYKLKKTNQTDFNAGFESAILVDEAHNIFLKDKTNFVKESITDAVYRELREYGISLICLDQHISKLSDTVKGNSACHIAFQQQLPADIWDISGLMQLADRKQYFSMLPVGSAIVRLSERHTSPFLIEVAKANLRQNSVSDAQVKQRMEFIKEGEKIENSDDEFSMAVKNGGSDVEEIKIENSQEQASEKIEHKEQIFNNKFQEKPISEIAKQEKTSFINENWPVEKNKARVPEHPLYDNYLAMKPETSEIKQETGNSKNSNEGSNAEIKSTNEIPELIKTSKINRGILDKEVNNRESKSNSLTPKQSVLCEFAKQRLELGDNLVRIENALEEYMEEGNYSLEDVSIVINRVLRERLNQKFNQSILEDTESVTTGEKQNLYKEEMGVESAKVYSNTDGAQEKILYFLQANPNHNLSMVEVYKKLGLSARKGTKVKDELVNQGLIIIQEQRNDKGWKKIMQVV